MKDARQTFLGVWIRNLIAGKAVEVFGRGQQRRDFNFVDDVVDALLVAAAQPESESKIFNLGHQEHLSLEELAKLLVKLNNGGDYKIVPFPADREIIDIGDYYGDFSKIEKELGWRPRISLTEGLTRTLEYYREQHAEYWESTP